MRFVWLLAAALIASCSPAAAPPVAPAPVYYQPLTDDEVTQTDRPHLSDTKKKVIDERLGAAEDALKKLTDK